MSTWYEKELNRLQKENKSLSAIIVSMADEIDKIKELQTENKTLKEALTEIQKSNRMKNDLDSYLFNLADWGLGEEKKKPNPMDYGIEALKEKEA